MKVIEFAKLLRVKGLESNEADLRLYACSAYLQRVLPTEFLASHA